MAAGVEGPAVVRSGTKPGVIRSKHLRRKIRSILLKLRRRKIYGMLKILVAVRRRLNRTFHRRRFRHALAKCSQEHRAPIFDQLTKAVQRRQRPRRKQLLPDRLINRAPHRRAGLECDPLDGLHRGLAQPTRRIVDHPLHGDRIVGVPHNLQVRDHVLDLGAFIEAEASHNVVVHLVAAHRLFYQPRLRVGAIQHGGARSLTVFGMSPDAGISRCNRQRTALRSRRPALRSSRSACRRCGPSTDSCPCV